MTAMIDHEGLTCANRSQIEVISVLSDNWYILEINSKCDVRRKFNLDHQVRYYCQNVTES